MRRPDGSTKRRACEELKKTGTCEASVTDKLTLHQAQARHPVWDDEPYLRAALA